MTSVNASNPIVWTNWRARGPGLSLVALVLVLGCGDDGGASASGGSSATEAMSATEVSSDSSGSGTAGGSAGTSGSGSASASGSGSGGETTGISGTGDSADTEDLPGVSVDLGKAGDFAILAKSGISSIPASAITGDLGVSPAAATYITGFSLIVDVKNAFATSPQVTGRVYAADYAVPTPSELTVAVDDMDLAFTDAAGRAADFVDLGAGDLSGMTLAPGVYRWGTGLLISTDLHLDGDANGVWIFQIAGDLTIVGGAEVLLVGGAAADRVFWQVSGMADLGAAAHCEGVILSQTAVTLATGASIHGRLLAQTAVSLDQGIVVEPAG